MGVLTDFFAATDDELRKHYPSWKLPLAQPTRVTRRNPFTRELMEGVEWDPSPEQPVSDRGPSGHPGAWIDLKGLSDTSVRSLIRLLLNQSPPDGSKFDRPALIGPKDGPWVNQLPTDFVEALASLDGASREALASKWSETERNDIAGIMHDATRQQMLSDHALPHWREMLDALADFSRESVVAKKNVYMWMCL
jgi:hypothetical protein